MRYCMKHIQGWLVSAPQNGEADNAGGVTVEDAPLFAKTAGTKTNATVARLM